MWTDGLFYKLWQLHMDPKIWRILRNAYHQFECSVMIAGQASRPFMPGPGIHQGDVWSVQLYCLYNNDLIRETKSSPYCTKLGNINCTCPTFVDDLTRVALRRFKLFTCNC